jgi:serine/threonine protein kinase
MDGNKANQLFGSLKLKELSGYTITEQINNGKSAAVFKGFDKENIPVAIKIFDNDLIERFGHEIQETRIKQEIELVGHKIPNLVKIYNGGKQSVDGHDYYYIVMQFLEGTNLKEFIHSNEYDHTFLKKVIATLLDISEALLERNIVHRDIKPENIMVTNSGEIILLDLGVLKYIDKISFSDANEKQFVGTLTYAPPEFLLRNEEDSINGWRAVNLYQIGGVLHDLIMKKELFAEIKPYPKTVIAIKEDVPSISNEQVSPRLIELARNLLIKDWKLRLNLTSTDKIRSYYLKDDKADSEENIEFAVNDFFSMSSQNKLQQIEIDSIKRSHEDKLKIKNDLAAKVDKCITECVDFLKANKIVNKVTKSQKPIKFPVINTASTIVIRSSIPDKHLVCKYKTPSKSNCIERSIHFELLGEYLDGFVKPLHLLVRIENDESSFARIAIVCFFKSDANPFKNIFLDLANDMLSQLGSANPKYNVTYEVETYEIFNGVFELDKQTKKDLFLKILSLVKKSLSIALPEITAELNEEKRMLAQGIKNYSKPTQSQSIKRKSTIFSQP